MLSTIPSHSSETRHWAGEETFMFANLQPLRLLENTEDSAPGAAGGIPTGLTHVFLWTIEKLTGELVSDVAITHVSKDTD